jgi:hypothetical protein
MVPSWNYKVFGLSVASALELPWPRAENANPDVCIVEGEVRATLEAPVWHSAFCQATPTECLVAIPGVARFLSRHGNKIIVERQGGDDRTITTFLTGHAFGAILSQRGIVVLFGAAVDTPCGAAVILGPVASGKSTVAAELGRRSYRLLSDGYCAVCIQNGTAVLLPGTGLLHLWRDVTQKLGIDVAGLDTQRPGLQRYALPFPVVQEVRPVSAVFYLDPRNLAPATERSTVFDRVRMLDASNYAGRYLGGLTGEPAATILALARPSEFVVLRRSRPHSPGDLADQIEHCVTA